MLDRSASSSRPTHSLSINLDMSIAPTEVCQIKAKTVFSFAVLPNAFLEQIWRDGYEYNKAGVMLGDFSHSTRRQISLFEKPIRDDSQIMAAIDRINSTVGTIKLATSGVDQGWAMQRERLSQAYTTRWQDIPLVR